MWGIDSFSTATSDIPNTHNWKARKATSSRFVFLSLEGHERVILSSIKETRLTFAQAN